MSRSREIPEPPTTDPSQTGQRTILAGWQTVEQWTAENALLRAGVAWGPAIGLMLLIFWLSSQPHPFTLESHWLNLVVKKSAHAVGYATLALTYRWALHWQRPSLRRANWIAWGLAILYAASDEYHQTFVPGRNGNGIDVLIDTTGAGLGLGAWQWLRAWFASRV